MLKMVLGAFWGLTLAAQTQIDLSSQARRVDFTKADYTRPIKTGTVLPVTCAPGDTFWKTDAPAGANLYGCMAADVWSAQGSVSVKSAGYTVGTRGALNLITGAGLMSTVSDDGSEINFQAALDSAIVQTLPAEQSGGALLCASSGGSAAQYTCALSPTLAAYTSGMVLHWKPDVDGAGGPTTLNIDTLGAKPVMLADGVTNPAPAAIASGQLYVIWYDGAAFRISNGGGGSAATILAGSLTWGQVLSGGITWGQLLGGI